MAKLVRIPEAALASLLREAGRVESVDAYLASADVQAATLHGDRFAKRANAAYWSRFWLLVSAAVSWVGVVTGPDVEGVIAGVLLTGMTVVEFRVHEFFLQGDERGPVYGWWNQCLFSVLFLVYGIYHGTYPAVSPMLGGMIDDGMASSVMSLERLVYYTIGIVGAAGQFWLACYYRTARK